MLRATLFVLVAGLVAAGVSMLASTAQSQPEPGAAMTAHVEGSGPPLVLLGGGTTGAAALAPHAGRLAAAHRVVRLQTINIQLANEGRPLPVDYAVSLETRAMRNGLDALGITEAVDVFGWSYGGLIALEFALNYPERIRSLALAEPPAFWVLGNDDTQEASAREMLAILRAFGPQSEITDDQIERFRCAVGNCPVGRSIRDDPRWPTWLQERARLRGLAAIALHRDDPARLRGFQRPVLIITGTTTVPFHRRINDVLAAHIPHAQRSELPGGHASVIMGVEQCVQALLAFLPPRP